MIDKLAGDKTWPSLSKELFNCNTDIITIESNLEFPWFFTFDDKWNKLFHDRFNITVHNSILTYGCVVRYLFTYDKVVTDAIKKEMQELSLLPRLYVSLHFRSFQESTARTHPSPYPYLNCSVMIASEMTDALNATFKVYLISDSKEANEIASTAYDGQVIASHARKVHVDRIGNTSPDLVLEGFIGLLVNIEVAAKGAVFIRTEGSSLSDLIESMAEVHKVLVIKPYEQCSL